MLDVACASQNRMESDMRIQPVARTLLAAAFALTLSLLIAAMLLTTRSSGMTRTTSVTVPEEDDERSPSELTRVLLPQSTAAYNGVITPATTLYAPWLLGSTTVLRVHNSHADTAVTVRAAFFYTTGVEAGKRAQVVQAGAVGEISASGFMTGTQLSAILTATQPIVAVVNDFGNIGKQATSYAAMPAALGRTRLALPDILSRRGNGWDSRIVVQNVGPVPTDITIVYTRTNAIEGTNWSATAVSVPPGGAHLFDPGAVEGLPEDFEGVATVSAQQSVIAVVRNAATDQLPAYIYRVPLPVAADTGSRSLFFPVLVNTFEDWQNSEIQIMNTGPQTTFDIRVGNSLATKSIGSWSARNYPQIPIPNEDSILSPVGQPVNGSVEDAQTLHGLVWLTRAGAAAGDPIAAYSSLSRGSKIWYLPYTDQNDGFVTYIAVQNPNDIAVNITLSLHTVTGAVGTHDTNIAAQGLGLYGGGAGLPLDFIGGVVIEADRPVVAVAVIAGRLVLDQEVFLSVVTKEN